MCASCWCPPFQTSGPRRYGPGSNSASAPQQRRSAAATSPRKSCSALPINRNSHKRRSSSLRICKQFRTCSVAVSRGIVGKYFLACPCGRSYLPSRHAYDVQAVARRPKTPRVLPARGGASPRRKRPDGPLLDRRHVPHSRARRHPAPHVAQDCTEVTFWAQFWPALLATFAGVGLALWVDRLRERARRKADEAGLLRAVAGSIYINLDLMTLLQRMLSEK